MTKKLACPTKWKSKLTLSFHPCSQKDGQENLPASASTTVLSIRKQPQGCWEADRTLRFALSTRSPELRTPCRTHSHHLHAAAYFVPLTLFIHTLPMHTYTLVCKRTIQKQRGGGGLGPLPHASPQGMASQGPRRERNPRWPEFQATTPHQLGAGEGREGISRIFLGTQIPEGEGGGSLIGKVKTVHRSR